MSQSNEVINKEAEKGSETHEKELVEIKIEECYSLLTSSDPVSFCQIQEKTLIAKSHCIFELNR